MLPLELAAELKCLGHRVSVAVLPGGDVARRARDLRLPLDELAVCGRFDPVAIYRLSRLLRRRRPDIVHVHLPRDLFLVMPARLLSRQRFRVVFTAHVGNRVSKKDPLHRIIYERLDKAVAISRLIRRNLLATCPLRRSQTALIHPGIDPGRFQADKRHKLAGQPVIGVVSRITRGKGQDILIRALARLVGDYPDLCCYLIGGWEREDRDYRQELVSLIGKLGLSGKVVMLGHRRDLANLLAGIDYFVFPSTNEAFGLSLVEAMAAGVPCLATRYDGVLDIIEEGKNGLFFKRGNEKDLAVKLRRLIVDKKLARHLGRNGRKSAEGYFSLSRMARQYAELFEEMSGNKN